jgi:DNA polymerase elongation subunit (family B)
MLTKFWDKVRYQVNSYGKIIGFNIVGFDLPYLIRRSWIHSVPICEGIKRGRYFSDTHVVDLAEIWRLGEKNTFISLDRLSRVLGTGEKSGSGKDFAALLATDREAALKYLANDLELTARLAKKLGAIQ